MTDSALFNSPLKSNLFPRVELQSACYKIYIFLMISKLAKTYLGATIPVVNVCGVIKPQL